MLSLAQVAATAVNPLLTGLCLAAPLITPRAADPPGRFWARCVAGIGLAVVAAETGKRWPVWPGHHSFPSGHETFALAAVTLLARRDPRWLVPLLPLCLLLAWALVAAGYHRPVDIAGALLVGPSAALLAERVLTPRRANA